MKLYFECNMGAAGDMLASSLVSLFDEKEKIVEELNSLALPHTVITYGEKEQCGIKGVHLSIVINGEEETPETRHHHHHHHGRTLDEIHEIIKSLNVSEKVKADIIGVYDIAARAEGEAHGKPAGEVHFHELGMLDAIADITITAYLLDKLSAEKIIVSPINVGNGSVKCAHGVMPVPAPATANILLGVPYYKSEISTELCTPTGAAILKYFADEFTEKPDITAVKIGTGCGTKELDRANILRVFAFEDNSAVTELSCNIDDMTGEEAAFAAERMMAEGALDCFISPIIMKKGRPAYMFTVLCSNADEKKFASLIFKHTTTIGIRKYTPSRYTLKRELIESSGVIVKRSEGYGTEREKTEYEDIKALALKEDISIFEARRRIEKSTD